MADDKGKDEERRVPRMTEQKGYEKPEILSSDRDPEKILIVSS